MAAIEDTFESFSPLSILGGTVNHTELIPLVREELNNLLSDPATKNIHRYF